MTESVNSGIVYISNDKFSLNGTTMGLAELIMVLELDRATNLEKQLADELQSMAQLNELLKEANRMLSIARQEKGALDENNKLSTMPDEMSDFYIKHDIEQGIDSHDEKHKRNGTYAENAKLGNNGFDFVQTKDQWEVSIENLKSFIDSLNSRSQLDMINISSLLKKRDESLTMPANTNSNFHQTNQGIIGKF